MGTRALTVVQDEEGAEVAVIYRQFDGYPEGLGAELRDFARGRVLSNGFTMGQNEEAKVSNGMNCLAATLVKHLKDDIGNVYLYPAGTRDLGEEYVYIVRPTKNGRVQVITEGRQL